MIYYLYKLMSTCYGFVSLLVMFSLAYKIRGVEILSVEEKI